MLAPRALRLLLPLQRPLSLAAAASAHAAPSSSSVFRRCHPHRRHRHTGMASAPGAAAAATKTSDPNQWKLYYWPGIKGRGEYVRLAFEEAGVPYEDVAAQAPDAKAGYELIKQTCFDAQDGAAHFPVRAPPAISRGDFWLCNTPAILSCLNTEFGWDPAEPTVEQGRAHVLSVLEVVLSDAVSEGRLPFHPRSWYGSHKLPENAVEHCAPYLEEYGTKRMPKYLDFLEAALRRSSGGGGGGGEGDKAGDEGEGGDDDNNKDGGPFLVGQRLTTADLAAWHYLCALERHYEGHYAREIPRRPLLRAFKARVAARPRIAAYLSSGRAPPWDADSLM